jgi:hypothetical protein
MMSRNTDQTRISLHCGTGLALILSGLFAASALAHTIAGNDANFVQDIDGPAIAPFMYLGAKHMITGYDHLLYLVGIMFFILRPMHVLQYVTLFAVGHSITLLLGVLADLRVNAYLIDAIIGLSIVYKAFENMDGFKRIKHLTPEPHVAVFVFGLFHGLGLATKLQEFDLSSNGLVVNIISFNVGVEIGQVLALSMIFIALTFWRQRPSYSQNVLLSNAILMCAGFILAAYQISAYVLLPA